MMLSNEVCEMVRKIVDIDEQLTVDEKKLEVRKSTVNGAGEGLFALERIPKGTIFISAGDINNYDTISRKMNDLSYHGTLENYDTDANVISCVNTGYIVKMDQLCKLFRVGRHEIYVYAIRDIEEGEELSRFYGPDYWKKYERINSMKANV
jgi:SET domain-containing protein